MILDPPAPTSPALRRSVPSPRIELTVVREAGVPASRTVALDGERFRVGSHPQNDLVLADPRVSRFHCTIERTATAWRVIDANSLNGTRVGGINVRDADLPPEGALTLGDSEVRFSAKSGTAQVEILDQPSFGELYGRSLAMQRLFAVLERVSMSDANVLIEGESGTGKELVATELVRRGPRAKKPLVIIDCSSIAPSLIESELFGHARGAFTGADRERLGAFESAHGGTVFLDEIGELPLDMQPKLLRALEAREIRRVGEMTPRKVDVRVVAATNRQLDREVNRGRFREDLFYRLSVVSVRVPPLRERLEDVELLVQVFLSDLAPSRGASLFTPEVLASLAQYDWPGNVRELRNYVERCVVLDTATPTGVTAGRATEPPAAPIDLEVSFREGKERVIAAFERRYVAALLRWAGDNMSKAARKAKMDRMSLYRVLQRHGIRPEDG